MVVIGQDDGDHHSDHHDHRRDRSADDGQGSTAAGLLGAALELPFQFTLG